MTEAAASHREGSDASGVGVGEPRTSIGSDESMRMMIGEGSAVECEDGAGGRAGVARRPSSETCREV